MEDDIKWGGGTGEVGGEGQESCCCYFQWKIVEGFAVKQDEHQQMVLQKRQTGFAQYYWMPHPETHQEAGWHGYPWPSWAWCHRLHHSEPSPLLQKPGNQSFFFSTWDQHRSVWDVPALIHSIGPTSASQSSFCLHQSIHYLNLKCTWACGQSWTCP